MNTVSLKCPLCCEETFSSHHSLQYHILSITDNLLCPACNLRFDNITDLADHLGRECREKEPTANSSPPPLVSIKREARESSNTEYRENMDSTPKEDLTETQKSISNDDESLMYMCVMCNVHFTSIEDHLEKYHDGEEVVLETEDTENNHEGEHEMECDERASPRNDDEINEEHEDENIEVRQSRTIKEQQCIDKAGRAYTRKVVKIDKFWTDENVNCSPLTENYVLENGQVRKITKEEASEMEDKDAIIQIHQCPKCFLQFPKLDHYMKHMCDPNKISNKLKCIHCSKVFHNYQSLNAHMRCHLSKDDGEVVKRVVTLGPQTCDICNTMFPSFKSLRLHQRMHDPVKMKTPETPVRYSSAGVEDEIIRQMFICGICNNTYDKEYEEVHMKSHDEENQYNCSVCNRKFYSKENLEMHSKAHNNSKKFVCSYCKKPFLTEEALQEHVTSLCQQRQYECQYCGRRFSRPHEKVKHERIHTGEKPHVCQICGKAFRVSYCLTLHLRTHSGTRPYQCSHCGKRFKSHSVYNHHMLTHSDVRAYKCPYCPKAFKTSVQLAGHKNSHTKPFTCTECNRPFASLYAVRAHMETHKRENNLKFDCWLCGATYARAFALRDHMKSQHPDENNIAVDENTINDMEYAETQESTTQIENEMVAEDEEQRFEETV